MKRIIYSIWGELTEEHTSADSYKQNQFSIHMDQLRKTQKSYADMCRADYHVFTVNPSQYQDIQFAKLYKLEELTKEYDEILYIDMDVIPNTQNIIFDEFDLNKISLHCMEPPWIPTTKSLNNILKDPNEKFSYMSSWIKMLIKKSMLLVDDITGENTVANTGVICCNAEAIKNIELSQKIELANEVYNEALEDTFHPKKITDAWTRNNEVFISYILERFEIDYNEIGLRWNYILDDQVNEYSPIGHFIHQVNKEFEVTFNAMARR